MPPKFIVSLPGCWGKKETWFFGKKDFPSTEKRSCIFDFRTEVLPPPASILFLKIDSSYLFENKISRGAVLILKKLGKVE